MSELRKKIVAFFDLLHDDNESYYERWARWQSEEMSKRIKQKMKEKRDD